MSVFADTSALYAFLDRDDANNRAAIRTFESLLSRDALTTHNYVVVETAALVHRRLGPAAGRALIEDVLPAIDVDWVDVEMHRAAESAFLAALRRHVSLVDWVSFELMRRRKIGSAFAFDRDFVAQGFSVVP